MKLEIRLQAPLPSLANIRMGWRQKARLVANTRAQVALAWLAQAGTLSMPGEWRSFCMATGFWQIDPSPVVVTMTRVAPRELDDDNNVGAMKGVRDQLAKCMGLASDRDKRVTWVCAQRKGKPALEIEIEAA